MNKSASTNTFNIGFASTITTLLFSLPPAYAQTPSEAEGLFEEIFIVGSRTLGRTADDLPVPVDLLDEELLRDSGQFELGRMLQKMAPSFNFSSSAISDGTDALRPATLRGLGPDQTLVLVNGKRRHQASLIHINTSVGRGTAGTDMNAIPVSAIERVEILRDGAAAQYGSDAIAGIINIVLKNEDEAGQVSGSWGQFTEGDGGTYALDVNKGFGLGAAGFANLTLHYRDRNHTDRSNPQGVCLYGGCVDTDGNGYLEPAAGFEILELEGPGRNGLRIGDAESEQFAAALNTSFDVGEGELYGFLTWSQRDNESAAFYRNPADSGANLENGQNPVHADGFLPLIASDIRDHSISVGYLLEFSSDSSLDLSYTTGSNAIDYETRNSGNYSYANWLRFEQDLSDDEIRRQMPRNAFAYGLELDLTTVNLDYTHGFDTLNIGAGLEYREDGFRITPGDEYSWQDFDTDPATGLSLYPQNADGGIQGFNGIPLASLTDETRDVVSAYLDAELDASDRLFLSAALRYDDYEGFGETINYKIASSLEITENLKLRSSYNTGFRAPSMQQLYFNNISTQIRGESAVMVGTFRNDSPAVRAIGVPELKEEESRNLGVGMVLHLTPAWEFTADFYRIDIDDRITISNQLAAADYPGPLADALNDVGAGAAQFFLNGANTETRGVDLVTSYSGVTLGKGSLDLMLAANYTETDVTETYVPTAGALSTVDPAAVFSAQDISIVEEWQPQDRIVFTAKYYLGAFSANLAFNRFGKYATVDDLGRQTYDNEWLTDIRLNYRFRDALSIFIAGNNIFDVTPDEVTNTGSRGGLFESSPGAMDMASDSVFRYSRRSAPFGFNGAFVSAGATYEF